MILTFKHRFEAAHRFLDASSKCSTPHGHTWWITLELEHSLSAISSETNYAYDFKDLKKNWSKFIDEELDHYFFINSKDPLESSLLEIHPEARVKKTPGDPTTEVLACLFLQKASSLLKEHKGIKVKSLLLQETPTNAVEVSANEASQFISNLKDLDYTPWWT